MEQTQTLDPAAGIAADGSTDSLWTVSDAGRALRDLTDAGGPVVVILLIVSVVALAVVIAKLIQLRAAIARPERRLARARQALSGGAVREALLLYRAIPGATAHVCTLALEGRLQGESDTHLRERVSVAARGLVTRMRSHLRVLEIISQVAPLLGLLGTILGMIEVFRVLEGAGNVVNPSELAGGIWAALLTTATGLGVAIPVSIALQWFDGVIEQEAHEMEAGVTAILTGAVTERTPQPAERRRASPIARPQPVAGE
jgi:biopolymer transport protein ExbB